MSQLPPLLLERLKRRGIIKKVGGSTQRAQTRPRSHTTGQSANKSKDSVSYGIEGDPDHEEILAEDYSDSSDEDESRNKNGDTEACIESLSTDDLRDESGSKNDDRLRDQDEDDTIGDSDSDLDRPQEASVLGCPNKYNIYHECSKFCLDQYSNPDSVMPTMKQRKQLALILRSYPMPNEWQVVYDPGVKTFYFWNIVTNLVSWLPPFMNGFVSQSADELRKSMKVFAE